MGNFKFTINDHHLELELSPSHKKNSKSQLHLLLHLTLSHTHKILTIKANRFPLPYHPYHNLKPRTNLEGPHWEGCQPVLNLIMDSNFKYALTTNIIVYPYILQMFWQNATLSEYEGRDQMVIESTVLNQKVRVTEGIIRTLLQLNDDNEVLMFTKAEIDETLGQMGYNPENSPQAIHKNGFIKLWQYLITQMGACFSKNIINHHEASQRLMEPIRALVLETSYNFSYYLIKDFASNMWIITSQLDFGGVPVGYARAEMRLQQNMNLSMLRTTNHHTGLVTDLWILLEMDHGEGIDLD
ncbi:hypothetical protein Hanom_Chr15g01369481 [Helianthus anomalus]